MPHAGEEVRLILLDALPSSAPETQLAAMEFAPHEFEIDRDARRQAGKPGQQGLPVGLPGSDKSQHIQLGLILWDERKILPDAAPGVKSSGASCLSSIIRAAVLGDLKLLEKASRISSATSGERRSRGAMQRGRNDRRRVRGMRNGITPSELTSPHPGVIALRWRHLW
jgi:hypothetical protein